MEINPAFMGLDMEIHHFDSHHNGGYHRPQDDLQVATVYVTTLELDRVDC